ncbi:MAG: 6,7-dimethyl-8-ribityllumazine synthase [Chitinophagaceae bacterium]|nr:MAG: 6,7-dimethyl-8-ribityllumazine synthase [Chitinophagaceae bacterium]
MADVNKSQLLQATTGILNRDACIVLVKTEWNAAIVDELEQGCLRVFAQQEHVTVVTLTVPGAVEIPFLIQRYFREKTGSPRPDAFIALGCVVRGDTPHFEYVCNTVTEGVLQLNLTLPVPVVFGVLTVNTDEQARERIGGKHGHKGEEAAVTALKMIALNRDIT